MNKKCVLFCSMHFFETYFISDILRKLKHVNFQMSSETRVGIHIKCFFQFNQNCNARIYFTENYYN
jgi:hypothetical protein